MQSLYLLKPILKKDILLFWNQFDILNEMFKVIQKLYKCWNLY